MGDIAYVFPGQGAQFRGMGRELFGQFSEHLAVADRILGYSLEALCLRDQSEQLNRTEYTQPALYVVNVLHYLQARRDGAPPPDFALGHSLGEYCALFAAGAFDFETGLRLVKRRGELMARVSGGGMSAVVGIDLPTLNQQLERPGLDGLEIANINSPLQNVVAGPVAQLETLELGVREAGGNCIPLPVSAPFHSRYMQAAMLAFAPSLREVEFQRLECIVVANFRARPYLSDQIRDNLVFQIRHPVRWVESIEYLLQQGDVEFHEIGPKKTLSKLIAQIQAHCRSGSSPVESHVA